MALTTEFTQRLGVTHPVIQAPMAGGSDTPALVAAVSEAGGLGCYGAAYLTPAQIAEFGSAVSAATSKPFGINLFAPTPIPGPVDASAAIEAATPFFSELGLDPPHAPPIPASAFDDQLKAALQCGARVFSFTFGMVPEAAIRELKSRGLFVMGTATTVEEARALERGGVDAVAAQGSEAGGHRGSFRGDFDANVIGTVALVPQVVDAVSIPVVASGGIMDGRGVAAALVLGASAVQMGTAFLTCPESGVVESYREAILGAREDGTRITRAFSGRPARGIVNRFMTEIEKRDGAILPFPLQNALTRPMRTAAVKQNRSEFLSLWAGQGVRMARREAAADLVKRIVAEAELVFEKFSAE